MKKIVVDTLQLSSAFADRMISLIGFMLERLVRHIFAALSLSRDRSAMQEAPWLVGGMASLEAEEKC